jgi:cold shock CspA family protein
LQPQLTAHRTAISKKMEISIEEYLNQPIEMDAWDGWVLRWDDDRCFGLIRTAYSSKRFVANSRQIDPDSIGRRYLQEGEEVRFTPAMGPRGFLDRATQVHPIREPLVVPPDYAEECVVDIYDRAKGMGFLRRPFGGFLFAIRDRLKCPERLVVPGLHVLATPAPPFRTTDPWWKATNIQVAPPLMGTMAAAFNKNGIAQ